MAKTDPSRPTSPNENSLMKQGKSTIVNSVKIGLRLIEGFLVQVQTGEPVHAGLQRSAASLATQLVRRRRKLLPRRPDRDTLLTRFLVRGHRGRQCGASSSTTNPRCILYSSNKGSDRHLGRPSLPHGTSGKIGFVDQPNGQVQARANSRHYGGRVPQVSMSARIAPPNVR